MTFETKMVLLAAFLATLLAATCSRMGGIGLDEDSVACSKNGHRWHPPEWVTPGWCEK